MKAKIYTVVMVAIALAVVPAVVVTAEEEMVTSTYKFEVLDIEEGAVVLKSIPDGKISTATPPAEREVTIDGKVMNWDKTPIGTILTATVSYVPTEDMIQQVSGKMLHKVNRTVVVLLDTGEVKQFTVEPDFTFTVDGQPRTIDKLTPNTNLTATSIKADPAAVITPDTPITGEAPK
jgi:hypothetical protein